MKPNNQSSPMAVIVIEQMDIIGGSPILMDETNMQTQTIAEMPVETSGAPIAGKGIQIHEFQFNR
jgi:hypothetical protein